MKEYIAISCTYYDYIEHYAVLKKVVTIRYLDVTGARLSVRSVILDTNNDGTAEYMVVRGLDNPIRMDRIISIEDKLLADYPVCERKDK